MTGGPLVISTMKNEGPYILEWVAHHRAIGFSEFLIYTNDCEDGTTDILDRLAQMGVVHHERNEVLRRGPHKSALKYAREHPLTKAAEWILVSDVDEYLHIHLGDGSVQALIDAQPQGTDAIPVTWKLFSHGGQVAFRDAAVTEQFTDAERDLEAGGFPDRFVKTLFRGQERVERFGLHRPVVAAEHVEGYVSRAPDGQVFEGDMRDAKAKTHFAYAAAQMNHYAVRSVDGFLVKRDRGRANHARQVLGADYWQKMCRGGQPDTAIARTAGARAAELSRLMADEKLARLHAASVAWHHAKIAELSARPEFAALKDEILALIAAGDHLRGRDDMPVPLRAVPDPADAPAETGPEIGPEIGPGPAAAPSPAPTLEPAAPPAATRPDPTTRLRALAAEMRGLIDDVTPTEAASAAHGRLDMLERGLFGRTSRG
ncbi:glycosyltransferase family 2 protein [Roseobacter sp. HKCCA0434]|uniref:glycosyltransferase family 2 protein n=1 Tax=Roseobacter sp. HKCCA0434 TaxID=3079297 RepID=UPI0029057E3E|nr:glycosyltransferase family 2 protein [Roseobacter sp. HKCCA0434]